jgi:Winged helix DNA-binding domain
MSPPMVERVLTRRELNRALLARQLLLERSRLPIPRVLERMGGLQAQYAPSMYVGLWTRMEHFERADLDRALERRSVVQGTLMRTTIHLVSARDYWPLAIGVRRARREWWLRLQKGTVEPAEMRLQAARLRRRLRSGPLTASEVRPLASGYVGLWLDLVRVPPSGTWDRRRADLLAAAEDWVGPSSATEAEGLELLARRYLGAFGPATPRDLQTWSGVPARRFERTLRRLPLLRFRDEAGAELLDLPRAPLPDPDTAGPVRFLPVWDATMLVHARRTGILPEEYRPLLFTAKNPASANTFLVDGVVAGSWRFEKSRIELEPFRRLDRPTTRTLEMEAERLLELYRY